MLQDAERRQQLAGIHEASEANPISATVQEQVQLLAYVILASVRVLSVYACQNQTHGISCIPRMSMEALVLTTGSVDSAARRSRVQCCRH